MIITNDKNEKQEYWFEYDRAMIVHKKYRTTKLDKSNYETFYEYDEKGNLIHEKKQNENDSDNLSGDDRNYERWCEYDVDGKIIRETGIEYCYVDNGGPAPDELDDWEDGYQSYEISFDYNEKRQLIHKKKTLSEIEIDSDYFDYEIFYEYDKVGHLIREKNGSYEVFYNYDAKGHLVTKKDWRGTRYYEYSASSNLIHFVFEEKKYDGRADILEIKWNEEGHILYRKSTDYAGKLTEERYEYDAKGQLIYIKDSNGFEMNWNWDGNNKLLSYKQSHKGSNEDILDFDSSDNIIHSFDGEIDEWYEYEFYDDGSIKKKICYRGT